MAKVRILLICGSGASTGFMAANMRKKAKERGMDLIIEARSEAEIENHADEVDFILLGPHLGYLEKDIEERLKECNIKNVIVYVMNKSYYSTLDGDAAINDLLTHMGKGEKV